jgi:hypothetical protein
MQKLTTESTEHTEGRKRVDGSGAGNDRHFTAKGAKLKREGREGKQRNSAQAAVEACRCNASYGARFKDGAVVAVLEPGGLADISRGVAARHERRPPERPPNGRTPKAVPEPVAHSSTATTFNAASSYAGEAIRRVDGIFSERSSRPSRFSFAPFAVKLSVTLASTSGHASAPSVVSFSRALSTLPS